MNAKNLCNINYDFIDVAKFIGIFLVIFGHIICTNSNLYHYIALFHMPLFFIISGFLYKNRSIKDSLSKIEFGLIIPYIIYQLWYFPLIFLNLVVYHKASAYLTIKQLIAGILIGNNGRNEFYISCCSPLWFVYTIILVYIIFALVNKGKINLTALFFSCLLLSGLVLHFHIFLPFCLGSVFLALPYFIFGYLGKNKLDKIKFSIPVSILIATVSILLEAIIFKYNGTLFLSRPQKATLATNNILLDFITGVNGSLLIFVVASLFKSNKFVDVISKNTLFIIFYHWFMLFFINWSGVTKYINSCSCIYTRVFLSGILSLLLLIISYYTILFLHKHAPILLGKYRPNKINIS